MTPYTVLGANETTLLNPFFRNSLATTPETLVPIGWSWLSIRTHALSSNRITDPSGRCVSCFVRTTTACRISPCRIFCAAAPPIAWLGMGRAFCTTTAIRSPMRAWFLGRLPSTLMHSTTSAPELSTTFNMDFR